MTDEALNALKIAELEKRIEQAMHYQQEAVAKASTELRERLHAMNEFRDQLREQAALLMPRKEYALSHEDVIRRVGFLETSMANTEGRFWALGLAASLIGGSIGIIGALLLRLLGIGAH